MKKAINTITKISIALTAVTAYVMEKKVKKNAYQAKTIESIECRKIRFYEKYIKRILDIICAAGAMICFSPLYLVIALMVRFKLGSPVLFTQERPGLVDRNGKETIFKIYKFRTMTDERDENGMLLPDEVRLTKFGAWLRATSLDELPEAFNILNGTMSVIGPRPQLVRDMVFMSKEQRKRHTAKPGLSGLAQVNGRNAITWEEKLNWDLDYIKNVNLFSDVKILIKTISKAFVKREGINENNMATAEDLGVYLLRTGKITSEEYVAKLNWVKDILKKKKENKEKNDYLSHEPFSVAISVYKNDNPIFFERALSSITDMQTVLPDEVVLVIDGPISKELNLVIDRYEAKYTFFHVIRLDKNQGLGNALKIAVENSRYNLIARMDSDDISISTRFEEQLKYFSEYPEVDIIGGDIAEFIDDEAHIVGIRKVPTTNKEIQNEMKIRCPLNHVSVMYKKSAIEAAGGYQDWFWNEDYYLWIRMWQNGAIFANTGTVLVHVRVGNDMYERRGGRKYFDSEKRLQDYMLEHKLIGYATYLENILKRLLVQIIFPNKLRGLVYRKFARQNIKNV